MRSACCCCCCCCCLRRSLYSWLELTFQAPRTCSRRFFVPCLTNPKVSQHGAALTFTRLDSLVCTAKASQLLPGTSTAQQRVQNLVDKRGCFRAPSLGTVTVTVLFPVAPARRSDAFHHCQPAGILPSPASSFVSILFCHSPSLPSPFSPVLPPLHLSSPPSKAHLSKTLPPADLLQLVLRLLAAASPACCYCYLFLRLLDPSHDICRFRRRQFLPNSPLSCNPPAQATRSTAHPDFSSSPFDQQQASNPTRRTERLEPLEHCRPCRRTSSSSSALRMRV
ncbi:hypothetical protein V8C26DRAFT_347536 [Trichoderma gracile]